MKSDIDAIFNLLADNTFLDWIKNPTEEKNKYWKTWEGSDPKRKLLLQEAKALVRSIDFEKSNSNKIRQELIFQRIQKTINKDRNKNLTIGLPSNRPNIGGQFVFSGRWMKWAAVFIGLLLISGIYYFTINEQVTIHTTAYGETRNLTLPDGSEVKLNGNSSVRYAKFWDNEQARNVWLEGEAFFTVLHVDTHEKFIVHTTTDFNVEVLGTEFNVNNRSGKTKVVLSSGKVMLNLQNESKVKHLQMVPGEMAEYIHNEQVLTKKEVDTQVYTSWRNDRLLFDDTSLWEIKSILESTYGLKVKVEDKKLLDKRLYGSAPSNDIKLLLKGLEHSLGNQISIEGNTVTIR
jgi:ferric-dicitrate binding protein FerR (iron transport regulator)